MSKAYDPKAIEKPIFDAWQKGDFFAQNPTAAELADLHEANGSDADDPVLNPYVITIPPPNVTGSLHMGHALNNTIQDVLIRKNRMVGRPTRWVVGTDHAGIATQNKVEQKLAKEGLTRFDIGREAFIDKCWEWRAEHGSQIINQLKAMGCSCDYDREWFTMDPSYQRAVREVFVDWFNQGLVYRGTRTINWCPRCTTALSDIEVEHEDRPGKLYHIRYPVVPEGSNAADVALTEDTQYIVIATTRPETMLGDVAVAVHPSDSRYGELVGRSVLLPLMNRFIPVIADEYVDPDFGTGALKITPAHDANDFEVGERHNLPQINIFDKEAVVTEEGGVYAGLSREAAREKVVADLQKDGYLVEIEEHPHNVGVCYRCSTAIEPWLSEQWFVDMKPLAKPAIEVVRDGQVSFHPKRWENVYFHWMENIRDWCISRQLWWGHRIPVFYCDSCDWVAALKEDVTTCPKCAAPVRQDEDVLDTWFSSQIWPFAVLDWPSSSPAGNLGDSACNASNEGAICIPQSSRTDAELQVNYPTNALSTAPDILFLWVARMVMSGLYFMKDNPSKDAVEKRVPFHDVIIHPTVFNKEGRRMSKSLGTGVDPLDLMEHYGADGMRFGLMLQVTGVQDMKFDEDKLLSSRNFANKIWNAARFVLMNLDEDFAAVEGSPQSKALADRWILSRLEGLCERVTAGIDNFEFGEVSRDLYGFFWSEFCDWYIELAKSRLNGTNKEEREEAQQTLVYVLDNALRLLHPVMPYVTEEIWQKLPISRSASESSLIVAQWPKAGLRTYRDLEVERRIEMLKAVITALRSTRARYGLSPKTGLSVSVKVGNSADKLLLKDSSEQIVALSKADSFEVGATVVKPAQSASVVAAGLEIYVHLEGIVDIEAEKARLSKERDKVAKDLAKFEKKLSNEGFLAKAAPEIIEKDRSKARDLREALAKLEGQLAEQNSA
ncbi:MAG: valine--tRNA ligase [Coriobacteriia bacterium]|nr:valine--tRNA ligase [Coriobacteriia bacterium]